ncbi:MAG: hypothetical protein NZ455_00025 [Bacteroidia bacterium]|nr:hypothetical protein [Bacteroidia bacterium]MDW8346629.1 hypothetical protein [Bacteroidia bacterium]
MDLGLIAACVRHAEGASAVRSAAKHRSDSAARSTPTLAQARGTPKSEDALLGGLHNCITV